MKKGPTRFDGKAGGFRSLCFESLTIIHVADAFGIAVDVGQRRRVRGACRRRLGRHERGHDGVQYFAVFGNHELKFDHCTTGASRRGGKIDLRDSGAVGKDLVGAGFAGVKAGIGIDVARIVEVRDAVGHDDVLLSEMAVTVEVSDGHAVAIIHDREWGGRSDDESGHAKRIAALDRGVRAAVGIVVVRGTRLRGGEQQSDT